MLESLKSFSPVTSRKSKTRIKEHQYTLEPLHHISNKKIINP